MARPRTTQASLDNVPTRRSYYQNEKCHHAAHFPSRYYVGEMPDLAPGEREILEGCGADDADHEAAGRIIKRRCEILNKIRQNYIAREALRRHEHEMERKAREAVKANKEHVDALRKVDS